MIHTLSRPSLSLRGRVQEGTFFTFFFSVLCFFSIFDIRFRGICPHAPHASVPPCPLLATRQMMKVMMVMNYDNQNGGDDDDDNDHEGEDDHDDDDGSNSNTPQ